jgi:hypothetical protein
MLRGVGAAGIPGFGTGGKVVVGGVVVGGRGGGTVPCWRAAKAARLNPSARTTFAVMTD